MNASIYDELGVPTVINAAGTKTRIGGSRIRPEARQAMIEAADSFVRLSDLQAQAQKQITEITGADAAYVTNGASGAMLLAAAACIAGDDLGIMQRLPDTSDIPDKIVMPRTHRTGYDHAFRTAGAQIVDIGTNDYHLGTGATNVEPWEIADAIDEETVAIAYMQKPYTQPSLETTVKIAHEHNVPVIVDAAAELPPKSNLSKFIEQGADLVAFSGGKAIRGPQTTGILAGRESLVRSAAVQHLDMHAEDSVWDPPEELVSVENTDGVPRQGIGRPLKVGKEELVGLLRALELFIEEDHDQRVAEWHQRSEQIVEMIETKAGIKIYIDDAEKTAVAPEVVVTVDSPPAASSAENIVRGLRHENPRVIVGADRINTNEFSINPMCLTDKEADYVAERILDYL